MKIVRAMKEVRRTEGEIADLRLRIGGCLTELEENPYTEDYPELAAELNKKVLRLIELKTRIMHTNVKHSMFGVVLELGELKGHLGVLRQLDITQGAIVNRYSNSGEKNVYKTQLTVKEKNTKIKACQERIVALIEKLDDFNAKTDIEGVDLAVQPLP